MTQEERGASNWLTTTEAAELLGVHPSTLRRWADEGQIPTMVTPGGHRRFARRDVVSFGSPGPRSEAISEYGSIWAKQALSHTRSQIVEHGSSKSMSAFDNGERDRSRQLGRRLLGLTLRYVSMQDGGEELLQQVREVGHQYAEAARSAGLDLQEALELAMFFRDSLLETTLELPAKTRLQPGANVQLLRRLNPVMNALQLAIVDRYQPSDG